MAECHLEIVTEQIIKPLKAFSFSLAYAKKRLTLLSPPYPHPSHFKKNPTCPLVIQPFIWLTIIGKGLESLTSLVAYPDPESTLKRMYGTGFPSLPVNCRRQIH